MKKENRFQLEFAKACKSFVFINEKIYAKKYTLKSDAAPFWTLLHHVIVFHKVENWLQHLEEAMRQTVRHYIMEAVVAYEEKMREQWIFDYPAQVVLTSSQIWWTTDVGIAFKRLEEGFETALKDYNKKQVPFLTSVVFEWKTVKYENGTYLHRKAWMTC